MVVPLASTRGVISAGKAPTDCPGLRQKERCLMLSWKQATSSCEMAFSWLPLSDGAPFPAQTPPGAPPFSLNADPGAELASPGSMVPIDIHPQVGGRDLAARLAAHPRREER
jgi:hypothetical protein